LLLLLGHRVISFLPDYYLNYDRVGELRRLSKLNMSNVKTCSIPDDISLLNKLVRDGYIIATPPQDYDDSYCITYAKQHNGYVITNDLFRDHIKKLNGTEKEITRKWIKSYCISYTFVGDEFLANPDSEVLLNMNNK
jgi:hypothetical protein